MASISEPEKSPLFRQQKKGGVTYRIPSLLYLSTSKTFLAFSEKRSTPADSDAECLVMRRGTFQDGSVQVSLFFFIDLFIQSNTVHIKCASPC